MSMCPVCLEKIRGKSPNKKKKLGVWIHKTCILTKKKKHPVFLYDNNVRPISTNHLKIYGQKSIRSQSFSKVFSMGYAPQVISRALRRYNA